MRRFPGRTLEELDQMDWGRLLRAIEAEHVEQLETRRSAYLAGKIEKLSSEEWERIAEHDRWLETPP